MPVFTTRSELLKKRVDQFTRVLHAVEEGDVRALHQARVASRRLRELVPLLQLEHGTTRKLARRLRKVTGRLGTVRELDVLLLLIDELHVSGRRGGGLGRVGVRVSKNRDRARKRLLARFPIAEMARMARKLDRIVAALQEAERASSKTAARSWRWAIDARVAKRAARLASAMSEAGALYLPERLHAVRIAGKKLRYAVELSSEAWGGRGGGVDLRVLKRSQELLGRMHDVQMLIDEVRQTQASLTPPSVTVWRDLDVLVASLEDDCRRLHARYVRLRDELEAVIEHRSDQSSAHSGRAQARRAG
jgi:CHAD domain-containing protein